MGSREVPCRTWGCWRSAHRKASSVSLKLEAMGTVPWSFMPACGHCVQGRHLEGRGFAPSHVSFFSFFFPLHASNFAHGS